MNKIPQHFQAESSPEDAADEFNGVPDNVGMHPTAVIDTKRTRVGDPDAQDAVWVCLTGRTAEDVTDPEAKQIALRYVNANYGRADGIDRTDGPRADDGRGPSNQNDLGGAPMSAQDYLRMAAQQNLSKKVANPKYVYFVRIRRNSGL